MENPIQQFMTQQALNLIGKQLGFSNGIPPQLVGLASKMLMSGMARNVQQPGGAEALFNALNNDHANSGILGKLLDFIPGAAAGGGPGAGILRHVLGNNLDPMVAVFSKATGLPQAKTKQLLMIVAPIVLGYMGKRMMNMKMNKQELASDVRDHYYRPGTRQPAADNGLLGKLLDRDGDGQVMDDAVGILKQLMVR